MQLVEVGHKNRIVRGHSIRIFGGQRKWQETRSGRFDVDSLGRLLRLLFGRVTVSAPFLKLAFDLVGLESRT
jgi:hypothetical protein